MCPALVNRLYRDGWPRFFWYAVNMLMDLAGFKGQLPLFLNLASIFGMLIDREFLFGGNEGDCRDNYFAGEKADRRL